LVHAAGNDAKNTEVGGNFPNRHFEAGGNAENWLEIGASSWKNGADRPATFSNYAKTNVDVFSPGVDIYSTVKDSKYDSYDGTSMASPVTAGIAALIRSYYPSLSAKEVKQIIMYSAVPYTEKVKVPGKKKKVAMTELCKTGAIVNAEKAIKLAGERAKK
jgi:cell wall-associated protease